MTNFKCGHPKTDENVKVTRKGYTECRICRRARKAQWQKSPSGRKSVARSMVRWAQKQGVL